MDERYLVEHLKKYIMFEAEQGYHPGDIKEALLKYGYHRELVKRVFSDIGQLKVLPAKKAAKKQMTDDMQFYIQNMLIDYMKKQQKNGYTIPAIKRALARSGHHADMINNAVKEIKMHRVIDYDVPRVKKVPSIYAFAFALVILTSFAVYLGVAANENILRVLLTFAPAIVTIVITELAVEGIPRRGLIRLMPLFSIAIAVLLFVALVNSTALYEKTNAMLLLVLNAVCAFVLSAVICVFSEKTHKKPEKVIKR